MSESFDQGAGAPGRFTDLVDLASERLGATVIACNDDFFAPKENLIKAAAPIWIEGQYTDRGKWMDGWETRRRRDAEPGTPVAVDIFGEWVPAEVRAEPLYDPTGERVRA